MRAVAIDLVWDGFTGWVYWDSEKEDPIVQYGDFKPRVPSKLKGVERQQHLCKSLYTLCLETVDSFPPLDMVIFEQSDWFQSLGKADWKKVYARERVVQRSLGMAEASFLLAMSTLNVQVYAIGAREAKQEFGAIRKDAAARILCSEYQRFGIIEVATNAYSDDYLFGSRADGFFIVRDRVRNENVPHHVTDAIVLASVVQRRVDSGQLGS